MGAEQQHSSYEGETTLAELWGAMRHAKWQLFVGTLVCEVIAIAYVLAARQWYEGGVLLAPAETRSTQGLSGQLASFSGLSGLASIAGISVGGGGQVNRWPY